MLEKNTLGELRKQIRNEFGLADEPQDNERIDGHINKAVNHIIRQQPNWPWLRRQLYLEIPQAGTGTGNFEQFSATVGTASNVGNPRDILIPSDSSSDGTEGYLISSSSGSTITLAHRYRGATLAAKAYTLQTGYIELPDNFMRIDSATGLSELNGDFYKYVDNTTFLRTVNEQPNFISSDRIYTIINDPLGINNKFYFAVFPYIHSATTISGMYYHVPNKLAYDGDEPVIPMADRPVIYYFAAWFEAQAQGRDNVSLYSRTALDALAQMIDHYSRSYDDGLDLGYNEFTSDLSALRAHQAPNFQDFNPRII